MVKGHNNCRSTPLVINLGTIQGLGIGPTLHIVMKCDLKSLSAVNILFKFADDTTLVVPQNTDCSLNDEFEHIVSWANVNKMVINRAKTKEIVFLRANVRHDILPCQIDGIERVLEAKLLGVIFGSKLNFDAHVTQILKVCSQRMYILKQLAHQGLSVNHLHTICCSIIVSKIMYAACAWGGHISEYLNGKINSLLRRLHRFGYIKDVRTFDASLAQADFAFFSNIIDGTHCANSLLPPKNPNTVGLRNKGHKYILPLCKYEAYKQSFIPRCLFNYLKVKAFDNIV